jgi:hypothetical protein
MKKLGFFLAILILINGCEQNKDYRPEMANPEYLVKIVGFDENCSTCIVEFPDDIMEIKDEIGVSPQNRYNSVNLPKGEYQLGQKLMVRIRKPETNELTPCKTFYLSNSYVGIYVTESEKFNNIIFNDTIEIKYKHCVYDPDNMSYICLDSVLSDSRCPKDAVCFWAGNAVVRFRIDKRNEAPVFFNLVTDYRFNESVTVDHYKFRMLYLNPYPSFANRADNGVYRAGLIIQRNL